ncbi:hypothetical protein EHQ58_04770 [Leptospira ognonensis]|uniref:Uncharacterized protein n=1 Tax=Leptospira ognonensis TaxID=2484945 RepID=A0A4R9K8D2_9LEPT|nr:hypothetical protein [Leptospira ognonensis]TGL61922.1 hypothetical protein EHQ58_04770 [Leptospira ognonensis]
MIDFSGTYLFSESSSYEGIKDSYKLSLVVTNFFHYSGSVSQQTLPFGAATAGEGDKQEWKVTGQRNMGNLLEINVTGKGKYLLSKTEKGINWAFTGRPEDWHL